MYGTKVYRQRLGWAGGGLTKQPLLAERLAA